MYNFIELCAGAGGLSSGFIKNNFKPIFLNDNNKICCETLKQNHKDVKIICKDMKDINYEEYINNIDVLISGIPCQSFSSIGKRNGLNDDRGILIINFINIIDKINPTIFLIENVKNLKTIKNGKIFTIILKKIEDLDKYNIYYKVLNANDYNVPQNRERLFIIGVKKSINRKFEFPDKENYKPVLKDVLVNCPKSDGLLYNNEKLELYKYIPQDGCWIHLPEELQKKYMKKSYYSGGGKRGILKRLSMNKPSLTLLTSPSQKQTERCHPLYNRPLQILEYSRIQTFPDDYIFCGSLRQQYKQVGNAVPYNLSLILSKKIKDFLKSL